MIIAVSCIEISSFFPSLAFFVKGIYKPSSRTESILTPWEIDPLLESLFLKLNKMLL